MAGYRLNGKLAPKFYSNWHVRLDRHRQIFWNGSRIDRDTLQDYLEKVNNLNAQSEYVSVEIEPGTPCDAATTLRGVVAKSGLCSHLRCTENAWNIQRPVVN